MKNLIILILIVLLIEGCSHISPNPPKLAIEGVFTKSPIITPLFDKYWVLLEELTFEFHSKDPADKYQIKVPAGFVTDLASIPVGSNVIFDHYGRYAAAGIIHDYLYWVQPCGKKFADQIFLDALKASGLPSEDRYVLWKSVDIGGHSAWENNKKLRANGKSRFVPINYRDKILPNTAWKIFKKSCCNEQANWEKLPVRNKPQYCSIVDEGEF